MPTTGTYQVMTKRKLAAEFSVSAMPVRDALFRRKQFAFCIDTLNESREPLRNIEPAT